MKPLHVHFMGIGGSGCASIAALALHQGYQVSGCDVSPVSYYLDELKKKHIPIYLGHDSAHITDDVDIVAVSPALYCICPDHPEILKAKERNILMTWQQFMGEYLQKDARTIAVSGTHGKTTTTFLIGEVFCQGGLDPSVVGGGLYQPWGFGAHLGSSDWFICEADEYYRNFHHYHPEIALMTNIEMDHPEYYKDFDDYKGSFLQFLTDNPNLKHIVGCLDDSGVTEVIDAFEKLDRADTVQLHLYSRDGLKTPPADWKNVQYVPFSTLHKSIERTQFQVTIEGEEREFSLTELKGEFNVANATATIIIARIAGISFASLAASLPSFGGTKRRFDQVGTLEGVPIYDDYAHHPTEIRSLLTMCRDYYPDKKVVIVIEPHQISRLLLMFQDYVDALLIADHVIVAKTYIGREAHSDLVPIARETWESASPKIYYEEDNDLIREKLRELIRAGECDMALVIGVSDAYKISRVICEDK